MAHVGMVLSIHQEVVGSVLASEGSDSVNLLVRVVHILDGPRGYGVGSQRVVDSHCHQVLLSPQEGAVDLGLERKMAALVCHHLLTIYPLKEGKCKDMVVIFSQEKCSYLMQLNILIVR